MLSTQVKYLLLMMPSSTRQYGRGCSFKASKLTISCSRCPRDTGPIPRSRIADEIDRVRSASACACQAYIVRQLYDRRSSDQVVIFSTGRISGGATSPLRYRNSIYSFQDESTQVVGLRRICVARIRTLPFYEVSLGWG